MLWLAAAAGTKVGQAFLGAQVSRAQTKAAERLEDQQATSANRIRAAENAMSAARSNLARFTQSVNNQRVLEATGEAVEANIVNARRQDDAMVRSSFLAAIEDAEVKGNMAAAAALNGVEGSAVDAVNSATAMRSARAAREAMQFRAFSNFDAAKRASSIVQQGLRGMDSQLIFTDLDANTNVARTYSHASPLRAAVLAGLEQVVSMGASGAFGSPATKAGGASKFSFGAPRLGEPSGGGIFSGVRLGNTESSSGWGSIRLGGRS